MNSQGIENAAILLLGIGEEHASQVLQLIDQHQIESIGQAMTSMRTISQDKINHVVDSFIEQTSENSGVLADSEKYIKSILVNAFGEEKAKSLIDRILVTEYTKGLENLRYAEPKTIANIIRTEHPQIIAVLLSHIGGDKAAAILSYFNEEMIVDLMLRMSTLDKVQPTALQDLSEVIQAQLGSETTNNISAEIGGVKSAAEIMNFIEKGVDQKVLEGIKAVDEGIATLIQESMFVFEDLNTLDSQAIQLILREISSEQLILALKGADDDIKNMIFSNMSKRAGELLKDDLEAKGPVKLSEVEAAQKEILAAARNLEESGKISLSKSNEEML